MAVRPESLTYLMTVRLHDRHKECRVFAGDIVLHNIEISIVNIENSRYTSHMIQRDRELTPSRQRLARVVAAER
jgi:hypothetical protein